MKTYLLPLLLGCALPLWLAIGSCTSADKCTRGELGCRCTEQNTCAAGARCLDGSCISATSTRDASTGVQDSGAEKPIDCTVATFDGACRELCRAVCKTEELLCVDSRCEPDFCANNGLQTTCSGECDTDVTCVQDLCKQELERKCEEFGYPDNGIYVSGCANDDPRCVLNPDYGCSDTCGTTDGVGKDLVGNGMCEDGGEGSVAPQKCPRSTDCSDCGTRVCGAQGATCSNSGDCCGFFSDSAYCVDVNRDPNVQDPRCLVTCTTSRSCEDGYVCTGIKDNSVYVCSP